MYNIKISILQNKSKNYHFNMLLTGVILKLHIINYVHVHSTLLLMSYLSDLHFHSCRQGWSS